MYKIEVNRMKNYTEIISEIENKLDFLLSHNKNYTKKQYYTIDDIKELIQELK